jgi:hypothetical protein
VPVSIPDQRTGVNARLEGESARSGRLGGGASTVGRVEAGRGRGECGELSGNDAASEGEQETEDEPKHGGTEDAGVSLVGMSKPKKTEETSNPA